MRSRRTVLTALKRAAIVLAMVIAFFPIFWLVSTSFKNPFEEWANWPPIWITDSPTLQNYRIVFFPEAAREFARSCCPEGIATTPPTVATCKAFAVEAHVARNTAGRRSNIADAVARSAPYRASQVHRKRIEEVFGWVKTVARLSKTRHRGLARVGWQFTLALAAYDLVRLPKLMGAAA